jgi:PAS domain S-box-containing protein
MVQVAGAIVQAKERYARSLIETSLDPLVTINAEGKIMDVNLATENVTGVTRDQLTGSDFSDYFTEPEQARASYKQVFSQGYVSDYPLAIRHVSGKVTEVLYNASVYRNEQGKVAGVFAAARDVTEMKRAVRDVAEMKKIETELRQANADLESFSYSVSHDLRAPLRAIDGFSAILREYYAAQLDVEGQRLFQVVSDNAKKMGKLIEDILFLSRANRYEMLINLIDMKALVQEVWDGLATDRTGRVIDFRLTDLPAACADTSALREVLQNLLGNAIKFTRGREPAIIEMAGYVEGKENIYFVRDNGVGFDMAYANKLFGLFQRLHSMTEFEGTGVGLAIVKRFIIKHGGRVWAEGKPGEGATFWFSLPSEINNQRVESVIA